MSRSAPFGVGDERVPQGVRGDQLGIPRAASSLADDPPGAVPVQPAAVPGEEHRPFGMFAEGQVDRPGGARRQRDGHDLAALAGDGQGPVPALEAQVLDVSAGGFGDPQPVQGEQRDQRVPGRRSPPGRHQQRAELIAIQGDSMRLVIDSRRRMCAASERSRSSSSTAYLQDSAMVDSRRLMVARARPIASRSRAKPLMSARRMGPASGRGTSW